MPEPRPRPPSLKLANDSARNDAILQIVSPIATLSMSEDMRNTVRISESIKRRQSSIIAAKKNDDTSEPILPTQSTGNTPVNSAAESSAFSSSTSTLFPNVKQENGTSSPLLACDSTQLSPGASYSLDRLASHLKNRSLKRDRVPKPLKLHNNPAVGSGPYTAANAHPGMYSYQTHGLRLAPLRPYFAPRMVQRFRRPPSMAPLGTPFVVTPYRREIPFDRRKLSGPQTAPPVQPAPGSKRARPVQDVFVDDVKRAAPLPLQPPLAQKARFTVTADDRQAATEEEMEEMRRKWEESDEIYGSMSFMDKLTFRFKILNKNLSLDEKKARFMEICETTWDEVMKRK